MDIVLAMLADSAAKKLEEKRCDRFPTSIERNAEASEDANYALYRYLAQNAMLYPQEWVLNNYGAKVLAQVRINGNEIHIDNIKILYKTDGLNDDVVKHEVIKTLNRASKDFPIASIESNTLSNQEIALELPLEWRFMG